MYPTKKWKCIQQKIGNVSTAIYWKMYRKCTDRKKEMYRPHLTKSVASSVFRSLSVFSISAESSAFQKGNLKNTVSSIHKKTATIHLFGKFDHSQQLLKPAEDNYHLRMEKYDKCVFIFAFLGKDFKRFPPMYWCGIIIFKMTVNEMLNLSPDLLRPWLIQQTPFIQLFHQSTTHFLNQFSFHDIFPNGSNAKLSPNPTPRIPLFVRHRKRSHRISQ